MNRQEFIGASEVAALLEVHPFKKPIDIFNEKVGIAKEFKTSKAASLGNHLEDGLTNYFCKEYLKASHDPAYTQKHLRQLHAGATLDVLVTSGSYKRRKFDCAPMDIKTIGLNGSLPYHAHYGKGGSDEVPIHVYYQLQQQMHLLAITEDLDIVDGFIGLLDLQGRGTLLYRVPYKAHVGEMLLEKIEHFWETYIATNTPPPETPIEEVLF